MDTRRLQAFVKIVDLGSVTRAAKVLNVAQPALSQQVAGLEAEFQRRLLVRTTRGVTPTEAGQTLYRYAKSIQRQLDEARRHILDANHHLTGNVTVGLAPFSSATLLALPLLIETRRRHPGIVLHIVDSFGIVLSELMLKGAMDIALLYGSRPVRGLDYKPVLDERFFLVAARHRFDDLAADAPVAPALLGGFDLLLPSRESFLRQAAERICAEGDVQARVVGEVESLPLLSAALAAGVGAAVLPASIAATLPDRVMLDMRAIGGEAATLPLSLCISDYAGLSDPAFAVYNILTELIASGEVLKEESR